MHLILRSFVSLTLENTKVGNKYNYLYFSATFLNQKCLKSNIVSLALEYIEDGNECNHSNFFCAKPAIWMKEKSIKKCLKSNIPKISKILEYWNGVEGV